MGIAGTWYACKTIRLVPESIKKMRPSARGVTQMDQAPTRARVMYIASGSGSGHGTDIVISKMAAPLILANCNLLRAIDKRDPGLVNPPPESHHEGYQRPNSPSG